MSKTNKTSKKSNAPTIEFSSDEEDEGEDFAPEILRIISHGTWGQGTEWP